MWKIKLILALAISVGSVGAWLYVQHLRSENAILTVNNANLEQNAKDLQKFADDLEADLTLKNRQARKRMEQIAQLTRQQATLSKALKEATKHDPVTTQCLAVQPGPDFVNQLRQYTEGVGIEGIGESLPGTEPVRDPDS